MSNILLVGNGAREHVMAEALKQSPENARLFSYMKANNPGIASLSEAIKLGSYADLKAITDFASEKG
nr:phosphoribosylamine--glycine ligase family protein [Smithellaceae bacterium]